MTEAEDTEDTEDTEAEDTEEFEVMVRRLLTKLTKEVKMLRDTIIEPVLPPAVPPGKKRVVFKGTAESARKMRVAKAAKRNRMDLKAWIDKYGQQETNP